MRTAAFPAVHRFAGRHGFTLVELLITIGIIGLLMALTVPAINSLDQARALTTAGANLEAELTTARETALVRRRPVEVRLYSYTLMGSNAFRAIQSFIQNEKGAFVALGKVVQLPMGIIIDGNDKYSSLLTVSALLSPSTQPPIPNVGQSYTARIFRFLPNGQTNLPYDSAKNPFLTLHRETLMNPEKGNFYCIQVDPLNGKLRSYRP